MNQGSPLVMGFGTFDGLHPGHLFYLQSLKKLGERLVVVVARDASVERIKGRPAKRDEHSRLEAVRAAGIADEVVLGSETDFYAVLREYRPDVIGLGYDQKADEEAIREHFPHILLKRLESHHPNKYKSSLLD